jgi:hypothetical protein
MLVTVLSEDAALLLEASQFIIAKIGAALDAQQRRQQAAPNVRQRAERKVAETKAVAEAVAKVKMAVLDMVMPTLDKPLRFCRGAEIAALGAGFQRLAAAVPPDAMIGEVWTDKEAAKLLRPDA